MSLMSQAANIGRSIEATLQGPLVQVHDVHTYGPENTVMIVQKNRVDNNGKELGFRALLNSDIGFSLDSKWTDAAYGSISETQIFKMVDGLAQNFGGRSINTPVWQRKVWGGTGTIQEKINCVLVASGDAESEVYQPVVNLCNMLLPRRSSNAPGNGIAGDLKVIQDKLQGAIEFLVVPGPSPMNPTDGSSGDIISIQVGNTILMGTCYLTSVQGFFSRALDKKGYPLAASLTISFSAIDNAVYTGGSTNVFKHDVNDVGVLTDLQNVFKQFWSGAIEGLNGLTKVTTGKK